MNIQPLLEHLEPRIAPASATFIDVDGDSVTVTSSKGSSNDLQAIVDAGLVNSGAGKQLTLIDFTGPGGSAFASGNLDIHVTLRAAAGDGLVNVGEINATGFDLGAVKVSGDLAKMLAGDPRAANGSVKSVDVQSIGVFGVTTGAPDLAWSLLGGTKSFFVAGDVSKANIEWRDPGNAAIKVGFVSIGGDLVGGAVANAGSLHFSTFRPAEIGSLFVGGGLVGGTADSTGSVLATKIGKVTVNGSITGGAGGYSGTIMGSSHMGDVLVGGSLTGGTGVISGTILGSAKLGRVTVLGSLIGGDGQYSGAILGGAGLKSAHVDGDLIGGAGLGAGSILNTGSGKVGDVWVGGSLLGGAGKQSGSIFAIQNLGMVTVGGSLDGDSGKESGAIGFSDPGKLLGVKIYGSLAGDSGEKSASIIGDSIGNVWVGGSVSGGAGNFSGAISADTNLKSVTIEGSLAGSNGQDSGSVVLTAGAAAVKTLSVSGDILGGVGDRSGAIRLVGSTGAISIAGKILGAGGDDSGRVSATTVKSFDCGSIEGGAGASSGTVSLGTATTILIDGNVTGSSDGSGLISGTTVKKLLTVNGTVAGGSGNGSLTGGIDFSGDVAAIYVGGNIQGGSSAAGTTEQYSGFANVGGRLGKFTLQGNLIAGESNNADDLNLGSVRAGILGDVTVAGSIEGNSSGTSASYAMITGRGDVTKTSGRNLAIGTLTVGGSVTYAEILGGYDTTSNAVNGAGGLNGGGAQLGTILVNGDFTNSSIATGVSRVNGNWADGANTLLTQPGTIIPSIAKIVIKGTVGAAVPNGIAAAAVESLQIGNSVVPPEPAPRSFQLGPSVSFRLQEVVP